MVDLIQTYLSSDAEERRSILKRVVSELKHLSESEPFEAEKALRQLINAELDYTSAQSLIRLQKLLGKRSKRPVKLAVLGTFTTEQLIALIELFLFGAGIEVEVYESDYSVLDQEVADPTSGLFEFQPDIVYLATSRRSMGNPPALGDSAEQVQQLVDVEVSRWSQLWQTISERAGCQIIQNNFEATPWRILNNLEPRNPASPGSFLAKVNEGLQKAAPPFVAIHDVDFLASLAGRWQWSDERMYYHAKLPCAPECMVSYAHSVASLIGALRGKSRKALVLDLDNTLWGGVIGDDGLAGIRIGQGDGEGEAFLAFQQYVDGLRQRGVILAVCSKNNEEIAREVFEKHTEMHLRLSDISCFVANWDDKHINLKKIAEQLEIGTDSLVFVDDNPAERAIVRKYLPEVAVPELPEDPSGYIRAVEQHLYFQTIALGAEDLQRSEMYRANSLRSSAQTASGSIDEFLTSLEMVARVDKVSEVNLERVAQLVSKSNQFNLTTRRHTPADLMKMTKDPSWITRTVSLRDRFGDNGLISVLLAKVDGSELVIDTWLMSCRVLKRGVEQFLLNEICAAARDHGLASVFGEYLPTAKNALVKNHYAGLGFERVSEGDDGRTTWRLTLANAQPIPTFITDKVTA
jgi:FkbH-like protein